MTRLQGGHRARCLLVRIDIRARPRTWRLPTHEQEYELRIEECATSVAHAEPQRIKQQELQTMRPDGKQESKPSRVTPPADHRPSNRKSRPFHATRPQAARNASEHRLAGAHHTTTGLRGESNWYASDRLTRDNQANGLQRVPTTQDYPPRAEQDPDQTLLCFCPSHRSREEMTTLETPSTNGARASSSYNTLSIARHLH